MEKNNIEDNKNGDVRITPLGVKVTIIVVIIGLFSLMLGIGFEIYEDLNKPNECPKCEECKCNTNTNNTVNTDECIMTQSDRNNESASLEKDLKSKVKMVKSFANVEKYKDGEDEEESECTKYLTLYSDNTYSIDYCAFAEHVDYGTYYIDGGYIYLTKLATTGSGTGITYLSSGDIKKVKYSEDKITIGDETYSKTASNADIRYIPLKEAIIMNIGEGTAIN